MVGFFLHLLLCTVIVRIKTKFFLQTLFPCTDTLTILRLFRKVTTVFLRPTVWETFYRKLCPYSPRVFGKYTGARAFQGSVTMAQKRTSNTGCSSEMPRLLENSSKPHQHFLFSSKLVHRNIQRKGHGLLMSHLNTLTALFSSQASNKCSLPLINN